MKLGGYNAAPLICLIYSRVKFLEEYNIGMIAVIESERQL